MRTFNVSSGETVEEAEQSLFCINGLRFAIAILAVALIGGAIAAIVIVVTDDDEDDHRSPLIRCPGPQTRQECQERGCEWTDHDEPDHPSCTFRLLDICYHVSGPKVDNGTGFTLPLAWKSSSIRQPFDDLIEQVTFEVTYVNSKTVRVRFLDTKRKRFEVPIALNLTHSDSGSPYNSNYEIKVNARVREDFEFKIERRGEARRILFDSSMGGLFLSDKYLQVATYLHRNKELFGLGHVHETSKKDFEVYNLFSTANEPNVHPFVVMKESDGKAHGILFVNSAPSQIETTPDPGLIFRTTGGVLDLLLFVGDSPDEVFALYSEVVGRPSMPPLWALGPQLVVHFMVDVNRTAAKIGATRKDGIQFDVVHFEGPVSKGSKVGDYVKAEQKNGLNFIVTVEPTVAVDDKDLFFKEALASELFIRWPNDVATADRIYGDVFLGFDKNGQHVAYLDFLKNSTRSRWLKYLQEKYAETPFNGISLANNEPVSFRDVQCPAPPLRTSSFFPGPDGHGHDVCISTRQGEVNDSMAHQDVHNIYGWSQSKVTKSAVEQATAERGLVLSVATFTASGRWAGHVIELNDTSKDFVLKLVRDVVSYNFHGVPLIGVDYDCNGSSSVETCKNLAKLSSLLPMHRMSLEQIGNSSWMTELMQWTIRTRYELLPYYYTLFYDAHSSGLPVIRGKLFEEKLRDDQLMVGHNLLVPTTDGSKDVRLPSSGEWFDYYNGSKVDGSKMNWPDERTLPLFVRNGTILATFAVEEHLAASVSVAELKLKGSLALRVFPSDDGAASGQFYWDDGHTIDPVHSAQFYRFQLDLKNCTLNIVAKHRARQPSPKIFGLMTISRLIIHGQEHEPTSMLINKKPPSFKLDIKKKTLHIETRLNLAESDHVISWAMSDHEQA